jgi:hypothetical protein
MASYELALSDGAWGEFVAILFPFRRQINQRIAKLRAEPRPPAVHFLEDDLYRLDMYGWMMVYAIDDDALIVSIRSFRRSS